MLGDEARKRTGGEPFRNRSRSAKRSSRTVDRLARRDRSPGVRQTYRDAHKRLLDVAHASIGQARRLVRMLSEPQSASQEKAKTPRRDLEHFSGLLSNVVSQTERRVFDEESVPAAEKLVSLFEPHTAIIRRGKTANPTEFGRKVWLSEIEGGIVSSYRVLDGNPDDAAQIRLELDRHVRLFGAAPRLLAADRG